MATNTLMAAVCGYLTQSQNFEVFEGNGAVSAMPDNDFIVVTPLSSASLTMQNLRQYYDTVFSGTIAGNILTTGVFEYGDIEVGQLLYFIGQVSAPKIIAQLSPTTWQLSDAPTVSTPTRMATGKTIYTRPSTTNIQIDIYSASAQKIGTEIASTFCEIGYNWFKQNFTGIFPLSIDRCVASPVETSEKTYLKRWILEIKMQHNITTIDLTQQFFDSQINEVEQLL